MTIDLLTEREKQCLRLLLVPMRAKEIATVTGLSVNTVNEHLKSARRKFGTSDSRSAALKLKAAEDTTKSSDTNESVSPDAVIPVETSPTEATAPDAVPMAGSVRLPLATWGRPWNDLNLGWRLLWPILLLGLVAIGGGAIVAGASELSQLALTLAH